ncbi:MAG: tRNA pseudouridine(38-40) synthase TruA [Puniceicoccales bacterium]|jgi:tRNA pseudouridine38-40 synthase|nr:tRNA pseudouridine(38-40) synthase TruA [Puniceicoccales bacterium]
MSDERQRWCGLCAYDGTGLAGWQSQPNANTVQDFLEARLSQIFERKTAAIGAGRTDAGVHARGQVFHCDSFGWRHGPDALLRALRCGFPRAIRVEKIFPVQSDFHARFSAKGKRYVYELQRGFADPFHCRYRWSLGDGPLDLAAMDAAAKVFLGTHNFFAFSNRGAIGDRDPVRTIHRSDWTVEGDLFRYVTEGNGYLYRMVRRMVGAIVAVGRGQADEKSLGALLADPTGLISGPLQSAPPEGLCLDRVFH